MAKETMIVFVYDSECLQDEADDPVRAVLYFHPSWVSDTQKVALCGQLMGTAYFLKDCFFKPKIVALQNGKFVLKEFGRFILAVGTDRNISDFLLQQRAAMLASLVRFFHRDLQTIFDQFTAQQLQRADGGAVKSATHKNLADKLYHIFETYLPILQHNGNIFHNVPKLRLPKTASNIFLDAIQTLQCCQQTKGILGGAILYHNKVVATQLSDAVTKQLVLTDPLHIRTTAEHLSVGSDFHIPNGVQMIAVYVEAAQYRQLAADAQRAQNLQTTQLSQGVLPPNFPYTKRKMKRDKSLIFTNIPEEGHGGGSGIGGNGEQIDDAAPMEEEQRFMPPLRPKPLHMRPNHLPLRLKSSKELPESGIASINFDETDSYPEFIGRTSVVSTPMAENKVLHVGNIMSICANPDEENNANKQEAATTTTSLKSDFERFFQHFLANPNKPDLERRNSLTDLHDSLKRFSKKLTLKKFDYHKTDVNRNAGDSDALVDYIENDDDDAIEGVVEAAEGREEDFEESSSDNSVEPKRTSLTITDPTYPIYNANGQPISRSLFQDFLDKYYKVWDASRAETDKEAEIAQLIAQFKEFDSELKQLDASMQRPAHGGEHNGPQADRNLNIAEALESEPQAQQQMPPHQVKTPLDKQALSLPLKPLTEATPLPLLDGEQQQRRPPAGGGGVPLTPLMAKLSVLALSEERTVLDSVVADIQTPLPAAAGKSTLGRRSSLGRGEDVAAEAAAGAAASRDGLQRAELYMCGQQNMTLLLLMEEQSAAQQQIVQKMFDICVAKFPHMEAQLNQTLNVNVEGDRRDGGYSFLCLDAQWDALQRSGPWNPVELNTLECMHRNLQQRQCVGNDITDLILRSHDTVYYGYKCGRTEFFYKEAAHQISGIPPPSDPMGNIAMRAKTRLERDHSYILF